MELINKIDNKNYFIVGKIENEDVLYILSKDILFCKNTTVPYDHIRKLLFINKVDKTQLKKDLEIYINKNTVTLGCLVTSMENCKQIYKNIKKIKRCQKIY